MTPNFELLLAELSNRIPDLAKEIPENRVEALRSMLKEFANQPCITEMSKTCVHLRDGTKIVLNLGAGVAGLVWMEVEPQATIKAL